MVWYIGSPYWLVPHPGFQPTLDHQLIQSWSDQRLMGPGGTVGFLYLLNHKVPNAS